MVNFVGDRKADSRIVLDFRIVEDRSYVQDAASPKFSTAFDLDGNIQTVKSTDVRPNVTVASYAYGPTVGTVSFGQPTDGLTASWTPSPMTERLPTGESVSLPGPRNQWELELEG